MKQGEQTMPRKELTLVIMSDQRPKFIPLIINTYIEMNVRCMDDVSEDDVVESCLCAGSIWVVDLGRQGL